MTAIFSALLPARTFRPEAAGVSGRARLQRKCACGGTPGPTDECEACKKKRLNLQTKLVINEPGDQDEQEADRVAEEIIGERRSGPALVSSLDRRGAAQDKATGDTQTDKSPSVVDEVLQSQGHPLDAVTRIFMEKRFGYDFGRVRVHADARAAQSAEAVNAQAYTVGAQIVFDTSRYAPETSEGRRLLAHELAHVVQQQGNLNIGPSADAPILQRKKESEQSLLLTDAPEFPGCSPYERFRLDQQIVRARDMVTITRNEVPTEMGRKDRATGTISIAGSAISRYFHTTEERHMKTILARLGVIARRLARRPRNWKCLTESGCRSDCGKLVDACAGPETPVSLCPQFFKMGDTEGARTLIHESAHQAGVGLSKDIYDWEKRFPTLSTAQSLDTPDAYSALARDVIYGGPLAGSSPWLPSEISLFGWFILPGAPSVQFGIGVPQRHVPPATLVENQFTGAFSYDLGKGKTRRPSYLRQPLVSVKIVLRRAGSAKERAGRPRESVLLERHERSEPGNTTVGYGASTVFFDVADRGTLELTAKLTDEDTKTTLTLAEKIPVRPTAASGSTALKEAAAEKKRTELSGEAQKPSEPKAK